MAGRRLRVLVAAAVAVAVAGGGMAAASVTVFGSNQVGAEHSDGVQISDDQIVDPIGDRLLTRNGRMIGSTVSPDGRFLAATSTDRGVVLQVVDLASYRLVWTVGSSAASDEHLADGSVGPEGPTFSPDGTALWLPQVNALTRFRVGPDGTLSAPATFPLPLVHGASALPGRGAYSADGRTLYVPLAGQNSVVALDPATGAVRQSWHVGTAPREVALDGATLYVSSEGGRAPRPGEHTLNSYGTQVPADPVLGTTTTGIVDVIDTAHPAAAVGSIAVGLHPTALLVAGGALFVANTADDTVSVIDPRRQRLVQTIDTRPWPASAVGYQPSGLALTADRQLLVSLGRANALAVYRYGSTPQEPVRYIGLLPTDYYPAGVAVTGGQVVVTNSRGVDARGPDVTVSEGPGTVPATGHGVRSTTASLTRFRLPGDPEIRRATATVFTQNDWNGHGATRAAGASAPPVPVPRRLGDPSTIQHVFLLVKENRTYDQVYGDDARGNGDPALAQFGEKVTPNQHALARQFGLYDNLYDIGTDSAEGHNWLMQGDDPEYTESSAGEGARGTGTEDDVLGHQRSGFLWTAVQAAGRSVQDFGEFTRSESKPAGATWQQYYCAATGVDRGADPATLTAPEIRQRTGSPIPSLDAITDHDYPRFDLDIPDVYRYQVWKRDFEQHGPAALTLMWLSSDHTGGAPDPEAQVADGDLAVGKIVDEISHSRYWSTSAVFVVEDDSQDGVDHVDGHRSPVQVISPWAQHGTVDSTYYSQLSVVRTIEQILGAQPLNQKLAAATPMAAAFRDHPDLTPFTAVPNQVPLTEGLPQPPPCGPDTLGRTGAAAEQVTAQAADAAAVPDTEKAVAAQWAAWAEQQHLTGTGAAPDQADPDLMNRYTWYRAHGWSQPYPGDPAIEGPTQVPSGSPAVADPDD